MSDAIWPPEPEPLGPHEAGLSQEIDTSDQEIWRTMVRARPGTRFLAEDGFYLHSYPLPADSLNELRVIGRVQDPQTLLTRAIEFFSGTSLVWRVVLSKERVAAWESTLRTAGFVRALDHPVMVLSPQPARPIDFPRGITIRRVTDPEGLHEFQRTFSKANELPDSDFWESPAFLENANLDLFLADLDGEACATGMGQTERGSTGIWGIATLPSRRGRGVGSAITWAIVEAGLARGATSAHLWSTALGFPIYRRIGFRHIENSLVFLPPSPNR